MQVIIPMSGFGERFRRAGYAMPKPLIPVDGRPMIGHVADMFPGVDDILFICNREHLEDPAYRMEEIIRGICEGARIFAVEPHSFGPVHAALEAASVIDPDRPTIVNYCDFTCYWDFAHFARYVAEVGCDGAIAAYTGFHPHMLGSTSYAYLRQTNGWVDDIQEKKPFTDKPMQEYASSGTYYFRSGAMALDYFRRARHEGRELNGEYYVSLAYKPMLDDRRSVVVYPLQHFMQWGTPEDLATYNGWSRAFELLCSDRFDRPHQAGAVMVPLAGTGSRFAKEGYSLPKPLVPVSGVPMVVQATRALPQPTLHAFVLRDDLLGRAQIESDLLASFPGAQTKVLKEVTDGQARTCLLALDQINLDMALTIGACDNGVLFDSAKFSKLMADSEIDVIVWVARHHPNAVRHPQMYGWVETAGHLVKSVSVKKPLSDPTNDPIVIGTFTFKRGRDFKASAERMISRQATVNGEYYVDTCVNDSIALGLRCSIMEVDAYLSWGTPDELRTFEYWQSCFHKWQHHPYRLERDRRVPAEVRTELETRYRPIVPALPWPRRINAEIGRFIIVGTATVGIDLTVYTLLLLLNVAVAPAKALGFVSGTIFAYFANRTFTFNASGSTQQFIAFVLLYLVNLAVNVCTNQLALHSLGQTPYALQISYFIATALSATLNYLGMKMIVFKNERGR